MKKVAILTGGGDCPGLNAVIRAITKTAITKYGLEVIGYVDGYRGFVENRWRTITLNDVEEILDKGGTILGTSNSDNPFKFLKTKDSEPVDMSDICIQQMKDLGVDCLFVVGGDGTLTSGRDFSRKGFPVIGVPKTIDNDLNATDVTFGFNTAVTNAVDAMDKLKTTGASHKRIMLVEIMGRYAGWLTLETGVAGASSAILLPEIPYDLDKLCDFLKEKTENGQKYCMVAVSEGAKPKNGEVTISRIVGYSPDSVRLGGVSTKLASQIEEKTGIETRATILGHIQRGGQTSAYDRVLSTKYGVKAMELAMEGNFGKMVAMVDGKVSYTTLEEAVGQLKLVPEDNELLQIAKSMGVYFGE